MNYIIKIIIFTFFLAFAFSNETNLNILNFNIHGFGGKKIVKKVNRIVDKIKNFDIIFIQENWVHQKLFNNKLLNHYLISSNKKNKTIYNSGLTVGIHNDYNVIDYEEMLFKECNGIIFNGSDCLASKGVIYTRINKDDRYLDIYNTHLDSGNSKCDKKIRAKQLRFLINYISDKSKNNSVIICGDFNINYRNNPSLIDDFMNELKLKSHNSLKTNTVDYIFYRDSRDLEFDIIGRNTQINDSLYYLSDHKPLSVLFNLSENKGN